MTTIEIDITEFDKSANTHIEYGFEKHHFNNPVNALLEFAKNPNAFRQRQENFRIVLTAKQNGELLKYLAKKDFHRKRFGNPREANYLLAFSYGQNPNVNIELATITEKIGRDFPSITIAVQWEIADILYEKDPTFAQHIYRIGLDHDKDYITTDEVIDKFIEHIVPVDETNEKPAVFVVAQAWHAPRCIETCIAKGLEVVGGDFSERFSPRDPQEWVRNAFSWVLKEGTRKKQDMSA